jgi:predicted metal-dependent phosphoesterase TrpH
MLREQHTLREIANRELIARLYRAGYRLDYENVRRRNPTGNPNRAHVAAELAELGYVATIQDAFDTLLNEHHGFYVRPSQLQLLDVIRELRQIGALPVLAHPFQDLTEGELRALLPLAKEAGLMGMETVHSSYSPDTIRIAQSIAAKYDLLPSGGSDFHGLVKPDVALGTGKGWHSVPADVYANLHAAWEALQK